MALRFDADAAPDAKAFQSWNRQAFAGGLRKCALRSPRTIVTRHPLRLGLNRDASHRYRTIQRAVKEGNA